MLPWSIHDGTEHLLLLCLFVHTGVRYFPLIRLHTSRSPQLFNASADGYATSDRVEDSSNRSQKDSSPPNPRMATVLFVGGGDVEKYLGT